METTLDKNFGGKDAIDEFDHFASWLSYTRLSELTFKHIALLQKLSATAGFDTVVLALGVDDQDSSLTAAEFAVCRSKDLETATDMASLPTVYIRNDTYPAHALMVIDKIIANYALLNPPISSLNMMDPNFLSNLVKRKGERLRSEYNNFMKDNKMYVIYIS